VQLLVAGQDLEDSLRASFGHAGILPGRVSRINRLTARPRPRSAPPATAGGRLIQ
jgi:hypothetical protein